MQALGDNLYLVSFEGQQIRCRSAGNNIIAAGTGVTIMWDEPYPWIASASAGYPTRVPRELAPFFKTAPASAWLIYTMRNNPKNYTYRPGQSLGAIDTYTLRVRCWDNVIRPLQTEYAGALVPAASLQAGTDVVCYQRDEDIWVVIGRSSIFSGQVWTEYFEQLTPDPSYTEAYGGIGFSYASWEGISDGVNPYVPPPTFPWTVGEAYLLQAAAPANVLDAVPVSFDQIPRSLRGTATEDLTLGLAYLYGRSVVYDGSVQVYYSASCSYLADGSQGSFSVSGIPAAAPGTVTLIAEFNTLALQGYGALTGDQYTNIVWTVEVTQ